MKSGPPIALTAVDSKTILTVFGGVTSYVWRSVARSPGVGVGAASRGRKGSRGRPYAASSSTTLSSVI